MKITFKSIKNSIYEFEVESEQLISEVIVCLQKLIKDETSTVKLIFNGQILDKTKKISDYPLSDGCVIIFSSNNIKPKKTEDSKEKSIKKEEDKKTNEKKEENKKKDEGKEKEKNDEPKSTVTSENYANEVKELISMGFQKELSTNAIKLTKGDLSMAVELLTQNNEMLYQQYENPDDMIPDLDYGNPEEMDEEYDEDAEEKTLMMIASIAKIFCKEQNKDLKEILGKLSQNNPEIINIIEYNQEEFNELFNSPITQQDRDVYNNFLNQSSLPQGNLDNNMDLDEGDDDNVPQIEISVQDEEAIKRLAALGFSEDECLEAYLACNKNEELAANYLFEKGDHNDN